MSSGSSSDFDPKRYSQLKKLVLLSGKRKCGKDYLGERLAEHFQAALLHLSEPLKRRFAAIHQINGDELLTASSYKEIYRKEMIKWGEEQRQLDPFVFCRQMIEDKEDLCRTRSIWIICDIRRSTDIEFFRRYFPECFILVRIEASNSSRIERGWIYTAEIDDAPSECQLDQNVSWSFVFQNDPSKEFQSQWEELLRLIES